MAGRPDLGSIAADVDPETMSREQGEGPMGDEPPRAEEVTTPAQAGLRTEEQSDEEDDADDVDFNPLFLRESEAEESEDEEPQVWCSRLPFLVAQLAYTGKGRAFGIGHFWKLSSCAWSAAFAEQRWCALGRIGNLRIYGGCPCQQILQDLLVEGQLEAQLSFDSCGLMKDLCC